MNICPECGGPFPKQKVVSPQEDLCCERCGWRGYFSESIHVDDEKACISEHKQSLEVLYARLASEVSPIIGKILIEEGLVEISETPDEKKIALLAKLLSSAVRGILVGMSQALSEEMNYGRN